MLTVLEAFPRDFAHVSARDLWRVLPGPTLVHLPGRRPEPLFVSVLLHGNEDTGLKAIQTLLARRLAALPRALSVFVGNVAAAAAGERRLKEQPDYNRVWPGSATAGSAEHAMMAKIVAQMRQRRVFASIDIHNNTGINPVPALGSPVLKNGGLLSASAWRAVSGVRRMLPGHYGRMRQGR